MPNNDIIREKLLVAITETKTRFKINDCLSKKRTPILKGVINGTVFSGHPTRTTLGNTLRVLSYAWYIAHLAQVPESKIKIHAAGDDMLIFIERDVVKRF